MLCCTMGVSFFSCENIVNYYYVFPLYSTSVTHAHVDTKIIKTKNTFCVSSYLHLQPHAIGDQEKHDTCKQE